MKTLFVLLGMSVALLGCQKQVQGFVEGGMAPIGRDPASVVNSTNSTQGMKISPGHVSATSSTLGMTATITPTQRVLTSGTVSATVSFSTTRVSQ